MRHWLVVIAILSIGSIFKYKTIIVSIVQFPAANDNVMPRITSNKAHALMMNNGDVPSVVHVVMSKFMQHQPNLLALGHARLELFQRICLQTMKFQDSHEFVWLILIDPQLDSSLLNPLKQMVAPHDNFFLIRTLDSEVKLKSLNTSLVSSGNVTLLKEAIKAASSSVLVYTRLDADDGLARISLRRIRSMAMGRLRHFTDNNMNYNASMGWVVFCISYHYEWHPARINKNNATITTNNTDAGNLMYLLENFCVTPGLSYVFAPGSGFRHLPTTKHQKLYQEMSPCLSLNQTACLHQMKDTITPMALRPRTATSAGMYGVGVKVDPKVASLPVFWKNLQSQFNITRQSLVNLQAYLHENVQAIAKDNLIGQCTKGHSCKPQSKKMLEKLARQQT